MRRTIAYSYSSYATAAVILSLLCACTQDRERKLRPARDEFSVMTYNLLHYSYEDRDYDGQRNDPKPPEEIDALIQIIAKVRPDVLAVQEMGTSDIVEGFRQKLLQQGLNYQHTEYLQSANSNANQAVLSRFPIIARNPITDESYTIGENQIPVQRGFISVDIQVNDQYRFRIMTAHLKSKLFHPLGQTEMRRNEARLLNKHVRRALDKEPGMNLIVVGDMNDSINSAALREVVGEKEKYLFDLQPRDYVGDLWTHFWSRHETYERLDYMLVSTGMLHEVVAAKKHVVRDPLTQKASDHRPVVGVFKAVDL